MTVRYIPFFKRHHKKTSYFMAQCDSLQNIPWKILVIGVAIAGLLLTSSTPAGAKKAGQTESDQSRSSWTALASTAGQAALSIAEGIATGDYRGYNLEDILPLEQVYVPEIALPLERHPSLLFSAADADLVRARIQREPYGRWWDEVLRRARSSLAVNLSDPQLTEARRAQAVKSCAFAWLITGQKQYLHKARQGLINISPPPAVTTPEGGQPGLGCGDWIRASFIMPMYCLAYDLTAEDLSASDRGAISARIAAEADQLYQHLIFAPPNNHKSIMATAVGTAALTIPEYDREQTQAWLDAAILHLRSGLSQIDRDGSYREGVFYAGYVSQLLFPFLFYLKQATGTDLFSHHRVSDLTAWFLRIGLPNGDIPLFDDAWQESHQFLPLLVGQSPLGGVARWRREQFPPVSSGLLHEVEFICAFDDRVPAQSPPWERTAFFPEGGLAVFGNEWSSDGIYLLLLGESGRVQSSGHEHVDPGHLILHAFGQELLTDPAAGPRGRQSVDRSWYLSGEAHNMLLVDGRGPINHPFSDDQLGGDLMHCFSSPALSGAAVRTRYAGTQIQRNVFFLGQRYFLLFDQLRSSQAHQYDLVLHGLGQARLENPQRVSWTSQDVSLWVQILDPEKDPPELSLRNGQRSPVYLHPQSYTYLRAGRSPRKRTQFRTLLLPQRNGSPGLTVTEVPISSQEQARAWEIRGPDLQGAGHTILTTDGNRAVAGGISTDARISVTAVDKLGQREFFLAAEASFYEHLGDTCFLSNRPVTFSLITRSDRWSGYLDAGQDTVTLFLETGFDPGQVRFERVPHTYRYHSGQVELRLTGSGLLELGGGMPLIHIPEKFRDRYPFLEQVARQENPRARWEELTPEQQLLAQQQAVDLTKGRLAPPLRNLSRKMGLGPNGLEQAFGVITGLADKAYDPEHWARLNLPEHLHGRADGPWGEMSYQQRGIITATGVRMEQLEGRLGAHNGALWKVGYYAPHSDETYGLLEYRGLKYSVLAAREEAQNRGQQSLSVYRHPGDRLWGLQGRVGDGWDEYGLDLLFRGSSLTAELSQQVGPQRRRSRRLFLTGHDHHFSPRLEWQDENQPASGRLSAGWTSRPVDGCSWDLDARLQERDRRWEVGQLISLITAVRPVLTGAWNSIFQEDIGWLGWAQLHGEHRDTRWTLRCRYGQHHRPFLAQQVLSVWRDWDGWVSSTSSLSYRPGRRPKDDLLADLSMHLQPPGTMRWHFKLASHFRRREKIDWGVGLDHRGRPSWGGEWMRKWSHLESYSSYLTLHGGATNSRGRGLRGIVEIRFCPSYDVAGYRIEIRQIGSTYSPGLLFSKQPLVGVRNDGFIRFRF
jgi:hypothetical protein